MTEPLAYVVSRHIPRLLFSPILDGHGRRIFFVVLSLVRFGLEGNEFGVSAVAGHQLLARAIFNDLSALNDKDARGGAAQG